MTTSISTSDLNRRMHGALEALRHDLGPAIVEQGDTTVLVPPGTTLEVDQYLNILIDVGSGNGAAAQAAAAQPAVQGA